MPIDNVTSTLPDAPYVAALERKLDLLERKLDAALVDISNLNRGRA